MTTRPTRNPRTTYEIEVSQPADLVLLFQPAHTRYGGIELPTEGPRREFLVSGIEPGIAVELAKSFSLTYVLDERAPQIIGDEPTAVLQRVRLVARDDRSTIAIEVPKGASATFGPCVCDTDLLFQHLVHLAALFGDRPTKSTRALTTRLRDGRPLNDGERLLRNEREAVLRSPTELLLKDQFEGVVRGRIDVTVTTRRVTQKNARGMFEDLRSKLRSSFGSENTVESLELAWKTLGGKEAMTSTRRRKSAFVELRRAYDDNTVSRITGRPAAEVPPHERLVQLKDLVANADRNDLKLDTFAAVQKSLLETALAAGYTADNLDAATVRHIQEDYGTTGRTTLRRTAAPTRVRAGLILATLCLVIGLVVSHFMYRAPSQNPPAAVANVAGLAVPDTTESCVSKTHDRYSGKRATLEDVARAYRSASENAVGCSNRAADNEERAQFLLAAADDASLECGIETNYDHRAASDTYSRAIALASRARDLTTQTSVKGEATEIIRQLRNTPSENAAPPVPGVPLDIHANS